MFVKDMYNLQDSSCQNEKFLFTICFCQYKVYIFEKENKFPI